FAARRAPVVSARSECGATGAGIGLAGSFCCPGSSWSRAKRILLPETSSQTVSRSSDRTTPSSFVPWTRALSPTASSRVFAKISCLASSTTRSDAAAPSAPSPPPGLAEDAAGAAEDAFRHALLPGHRERAAAAREARVEPVVGSPGLLIELHRRRDGVGTRSREILQSRKMRRHDDSRPAREALLE